jgi:hypothetical protein
MGIFGFTTKILTAGAKGQDKLGFLRKKPVFSIRMKPVGRHTGPPGRRFPSPAGKKLPILAFICFYQ